MTISRRTTLALGTGAVASVLLPMPIFASATSAIEELTGGADLGEGIIDLTAPEIAENGNSVPITVSAEGAKSITLFADGNPEPIITKMNFGPLSADSSASTRVRLATTQNVVAVAEMEDGTWQKASAEVKVTIGGCGG